MKNKATKQQLIRRLHTLRGIVGMSQDDYNTLLDSYGVASSKEMDREQLEKLCRFLAGMCGKGPVQTDRLRKNLLAAVCQFCTDVVGQWELMTDTQRIAYAKGVICRAAKVENGSFNRIGRVRLRSLTAMFNKMRRDMDGVVRETYKALGI